MNRSGWALLLTFSRKESVLGSRPQVISFFFALLALASGFVVQPVRPLPTMPLN